MVLSTSYKDRKAIEEDLEGYTGGGGEYIYIIGLEKNLSVNQAIFKAKSFTVKKHFGLVCLLQKCSNSMRNP